METIQTLSIIGAVVIVLLLFVAYGRSGRTTERADGSYAVPPEFWVKAVISLLFTVAALYIIIFKPDSDAQTKTWAFSALSLVAGVWIGTVTK
jgi:uncharacterized membrane protein